MSTTTERRIIKNRRMDIDGLLFELSVKRVTDTTTSAVTYEGDLRALGFGSPRHRFTFEATRDVTGTAYGVARNLLHRLLDAQRALDEAGEVLYVTVASMPGYAADAFENANTRVVGYDYCDDRFEGQDKRVTVYATTDAQALGRALSEAGNVGDRSGDDAECYEDYFPRPVQSSGRFIDVMEYTYTNDLAIYVLGLMGELAAETA